MLSHRNATPITLGTTSYSNLHLFRYTPGGFDEPCDVAARSCELSRVQLATGSTTRTKTMGIVLVAFFTAERWVRDFTYNPSTLRLHHIADKAPEDGPLPSAYRYSMAICFSLNIAEIRSPLPECFRSKQA